MLHYFRSVHDSVRFSVSVRFRVSNSVRARVKIYGRSLDNEVLMWSL